jgi:hypothetical protein
MHLTVRDKGNKAHRLQEISSRRAHEPPRSRSWLHLATGGGQVDAMADEEPILKAKRVSATRTTPSARHLGAPQG